MLGLILIVDTLDFRLPSLDVKMARDTTTKKERKPNGTLILAEIENLHLRLMLQIFVANQHYPLPVYLKEIMPVY